MKTNPSSSITTIKVSTACRDAFNEVAASLNVSAGEVAESALEALQTRSIPANVLLPLDILRALELTASSTRRLGVLLSRLEILVLTARRAQLDAADCILAEMSEASSTPTSHGKQP
jgi:hypothetical protein